ncbi:MAG TPA: DUF4157 domain-containing protein [Acidimicrobiia bacterium]|nr:DUF4157 domain-containing protein [Acidimicrobiia bacterium]
MNAAAALAASGLDTSELPPLIQPVKPEQVTLRPAPALMRKTWGKGIQAMTLGNTVYIDPAALGGPSRKLGLLVIHELVHVRQWRKRGVVPFLGSYLGDYFRGRRRKLGHRGAYRDIAVEVEAREIASRFA